jgi:membrane associated rhomboid family serine protease
MLPLRDNIPARRYPGVTFGLVALNVFAFLYELRLGSDLEVFLFRWGLVPVRYTHLEIAQFFSLPQQLLPFFTSQFLHGGWTHLLGNLWILWIFGDNVEDRVGHGRYLLLYLCGGAMAGLLHVTVSANSSAPTIGASGAVAVVMGAYFRFYPQARVTTLIPPFFLGPFLELPAVLFLGVWFLIQFFSGTLSLLTHPGHIGGIAWWAHIGGFLFGALTCHIFADSPVRRRPEEREGDWQA